MFFGTLLKADWACQYYSHWKVGPVTIPWNVVRNKSDLSTESGGGPHSYGSELWIVKYFANLQCCAWISQYPQPTFEFEGFSAWTGSYPFQSDDVPPQGHWDVACWRPAASWDRKSPTRFVMELGIVHSCGSGGNICEVSGMLNSSSISTFSGSDKGSCLIQTKASQCAGAAWFLCQSDEIQTSASKRREYQNPKMPYIVGAVDACECKFATKSDNANSLAIIGRSALTPLQTFTTLVWNIKLIESHALVFMITCTLSKLLILKLSVSFKPLQFKGYESLDALTLKFHIVEKALVPVISQIVPWNSPPSRVAWGVAGC